MPFHFASPTFGVRDAMIAPRVGDGTYGTSIDVMSCRVLGIQFNTVNAQLEGDDKITDTHAVIISATVTLTFGGVNPDIIKAITGAEDATTGTSPSKIRTMQISNENMKYFGLAGKINSTRSGDQHIFIPQLKVMEGFTLRYEYGNYAIPELTCMAIADEMYENTAGENVITYLRWNQAAAAVTIPPTGITHIS